MPHGRTFAVFGASGHVGIPCLSVLSKDRHRIRALVHSKGGADLAASHGAEPIQVSLDDREGFQTALQGIDGLFLVIPMNPHERTNMIEGSQQMIRGVIDAAVEAQVPHIVALSSMGAHRTNCVGPMLQMHKLEKTLMNSNIPHTILRAPAFFDNWRHPIDVARTQGILRSLLPHPDRKFPQASSEDVGRIAAELLIAGPSRDPEERRRVVEVHGPEDYSVNDIAEALTEILGRQVTVEVVAPEKREGTLRDAGMSDTNAKIMAEMYGQGMFEFEGRGEEFKGRITLINGIKAILNSGEPNRRSH